MSAMAILTHL